MYIYIHRERERDIDIGIYVSVYIYIYIIFLRAELHLGAVLLLLQGPVLGPELREQPAVLADHLVTKHM